MSKKKRLPARLVRGGGEFGRIFRGLVFCLIQIIAAIGIAGLFALGLTEYGINLPESFANAVAVGKYFDSIFSSAIFQFFALISGNERHPVRLAFSIFVLGSISIANIRLHMHLAMKKTKEAAAIRAAYKFFKENSLGREDAIDVLATFSAEVWHLRGLALVSETPEVTILKHDLTEYIKDIEDYCSPEMSPLQVNDFILEVANQKLPVRHRLILIYYNFALALVFGTGGLLAISNFLPAP